MAGHDSVARAQTTAPTLATPAPGAEVPTAAALHVLDVPFVPQSAALCGGAALAMVMRFWGEPGVHAEDFASLAGTDGAGIRTGDLERAALERGWRALPFTGGLAEACHQLQRGRPIVALIREPGGANHYVVVVGATADRVFVHDPARGPFRVVDATRLRQAWREAGEWGLLVLPSDHVQSDSLRVTATSGGSEPAQGVAPLVELAGVRFREKRWSEAGALAERATRLQPRDAYSWDLLATARFMEGDAAAALTAWNQIAQPQVDLTRVDGLERTRYEVVSRLIDQAPGMLLTDASLRRARRRVASLPSAQGAWVEYLPLPNGAAQVNVNVLEHPRWSLGAPALAAAMRGVADRVVRLELATPTGNGELWSARWRWQKDSPVVAVRLDLPSTWSALGIWHVETRWQRQEYRRRKATLPQTVRLERRRSAVGCSQWATADWRWDVTGASEHWSGGGRYGAIEVGLERRAALDRLRLRGEVSRAWSATGRAPYATSTLLVSWRSSSAPEHRTLRVLCHLGAATATKSAPLLLWPGADAAAGEASWVRAQPVLDGGGISEDGLMRALAHAGLETQFWPWPMSVLSLGLAGFVDVARPGSWFGSRAASLQADVGAGLRLRLPAQSDLLRLDVRRARGDGPVIFSIGIETDRWLHG